LRQLSISDQYARTRLQYSLIAFPVDVIEPIKGCQQQNAHGETAFDEMDRYKMRTDPDFILALILCIQAIRNEKCFNHQNK
jgi:hypothetical protein